MMQGMQGMQMNRSNVEIQTWVNEHVLSKYGPKRWPPQFFNGQTGCFCCAGTTAKGYHYGGLVQPAGARSAVTQEYDLSGDSWTNKTNMTSARYAANGGAVNGKAYAPFGNNSALVKQQTLYEYVVDSWATKTSGPSPTRDFHSSAGDSTDLYCVCGSSTVALSDNDAWNQSGDSWTSKTNVTSPTRTQQGAGFLGSYLYIAGGIDSTATYLRDVDRYDPSGDSYTAKTDIPTPARSIYAALSVLDSKLYAVGGTGVAYYQDTDEYVEDTWTSRANLSGGKVVSATAILSSYLHSFGGFTSSSPFYMGTNEQYVVDTWTTKTAMTGAAYGGGCSI